MQKHLANYLPIGGSRRNVRFWISHNDSWVKIKLRPNVSRFDLKRNGEVPEEGIRGNVVDLCGGGLNDEGYAWSEEQYILEHSYPGDAWGWFVRRDLASASKCSDGRYSSAQTDYCAIDRLDAWQPYEGLAEGYACPKTPDWETEDERQRDYSAEAMNY
jgi:hypothetical protein